MPSERHQPTISFEVGLRADLAQQITERAKKRGVDPTDLLNECVARTLRRAQDPVTHRGCTLSSRLTQREFDQVRRAAEYAGLCPSEWGRQVALKASDPERQALVFEFDAMRQLQQGIIAPLGQRP